MSLNQDLQSMPPITLLLNEFPMADVEMVKSILQQVGGDLKKAADSIRDMGFNQKKDAAVAEQIDIPKVKKISKAEKNSSKKKLISTRSAVTAATTLWGCCVFRLFRVCSIQERYIQYLLFTKLELVSCTPEYVLRQILKLDWSDDETGDIVVRQLLKPHKLSTHAIEKYAQIMSGLEKIKPMLFSVVLDILLETLRNFIEGQVNFSKKSTKTNKTYAWGAPTIEGSPMQQGTELSSSSIRKLLLKQQAQRVVAIGHLIGFLNKYEVVTDSVVCEVIIMLCRYLPSLDDDDGTTRLQTACAIIDNCKENSTLIEIIIPLVANYASSKTLSSDVVGAVMQTVSRISCVSLSVLAEQGQGGSFLPPLWFSFINHLSRSGSVISCDDYLKGISSETLWPVDESWAAVRVSEDPQSGHQSSSKPSSPTGMGRGKITDEDQIQKLLDSTILAERTAAKLRPSGRGSSSGGGGGGIIPRKR